MARLTQNAQEMYRILTEESATETQGKKFSKEKKALVEYILQLEGNEKRQAIQNALNIAHPLGKAIHQTNLFNKTKTRQLIELLQSQLEPLTPSPQPSPAKPVLTNSSKVYGRLRGESEYTDTTFAIKSDILVSNPTKQPTPRPLRPLQIANARDTNHGDFTFDSQSAKASKHKRSKSDSMEESLLEHSEVPTHRRNSPRSMC